MNLLVGLCVGRLECLREMVGVESGQPARGTNSQRTLFVLGETGFILRLWEPLKGFLCILSCKGGLEWCEAEETRE